ncbi:MAG: response regulator [Nitrospirae bacterium]|nr:response regulator [Nitrospirota bacterium]MBI3594035.1 response regulator [Nitrospirota bacterium]
MKTLIVDDSGPIRKIMKKMLVEMRHEVLEAENGQDALRQLESHPDIGLMLTDWNMPVMTGIELLEAIRGKGEFFPKPVIVMVTTENEESKIARALVTGADEYIMKPFSKEILEEKLNLLGIEKGSA